MKVKETQAPLTDGRKVLLKSASKEDAKALFLHRKATSGETYFMVRYPEEFQGGYAQTEEKIAAMEASEKEFYLTAFLDGNIIGDAGIFKIMDWMKCQHRCGFGISILQEYSGLGLGSQMVKAALAQAEENGFGQVELGVFSDNFRAIRLYEKFGFQKTGVCPRAFRLKDGTYRDEIQMVRMLGEGNCTAGNQKGQLSQEIEFLDTGFLENDEIKLTLERTAGADEENGYLPCYYFAICDKNGRKMGTCDLRVGHNENTLYGGNLGYEVEEPYRGRHYAGKACLLLFELAKKHQMGYVTITCSPENTASRKTCEYAGGVFQGIFPLPEWNEMYQMGSREKCRYHVELG